MLIWLVDFDGKIENLALMRLSAWHKAHGDTVRLKRGEAYPELFETPDKVYISCLFMWNRRAALALADAWGDIAEIGGTGVDVEKKLPPEVATAPPDYDLYGEARAIGFISRGCPNRCPWCVVPQKEGRLRRVATAQEIVGDHKDAHFLDNNFLALPGHMDDLLWLAKNQIKVDFNQGLDARLIDDEVACLLAACKSAMPGGGKVRLALDSPAQIPAVERALDCLINEAGIAATQIVVYCLIGHSGIKSDVERLWFLRQNGVRVYPMGYCDTETGEEPKRGWNHAQYRDYRRWLIRVPFSANVWARFEREMLGNGVGQPRLLF